MWSFSRDAVAAAGIIGCFVLVAAIQGGGGFSREATDDSLYETTGSIGSINPAILPLSEQQRERIHQGLMRFPDATRASEQAPVLADRVPREQPLQELPRDAGQLRSLGHRAVRAREDGRDVALLEHVLSELSRGRHRHDGLR